MGMQTVMPGGDSIDFQSVLALADKLDRIQLHYPNYQFLTNF